MSEQSKTDATPEPAADAPAAPTDPADPTASDGDESAFDALKAVEELEASIADADRAAPQQPEQHGESYTEILESELEQLNAELAARDKQLADKDKQLAALLDDVDKSKNRIERESARVLEQRSRKLLLAFLDVLDDLERALTAARAIDHNPAVIEGVELVHKSFVTRLASFGVKHCPAMGQPFDPEHHEAVSMVPATDPDQNGKVIAVISEGYTIGDETLRPARVAVGRSPDAG